MKRSAGLRRRTLLASGALTLAVAAVIGLLLATVESLRDSQTLANNSERVLARAADSERLLIDMETGLRGFVITDRPDFLQPFEAALRTFPAAAAELESLTADQPTQHDSARAIDAGIRSYANDYAVPLIRLARTNPMAARNVVATAAGKRRVDRIRGEFHALQATEAAHAQSRRAHADSIATRATIEAIVGLLGLIALVVFIGRYLRSAAARAEDAAADAYYAEARLAVLARASEVLAESLDYERTLEQVAQIAVPAVADWCSVDLPAPDGALRNVAVAHTDPAKVELARELQQRYPPRPDDPTGAPNVLRTGTAELYTEIPDELLVAGARDEEHLRISRDLGLVSAMVVPLLARGRTLGVITLVSSDSGRRYHEADLDFAQDLARRAALAIDNARLYAHERDVAETLQRSLLPDTMPVIPHATLAARYLPAEASVHVGGDWYDVIPLGDGRFTLAIGDVVGNGVKAAATMGQLRSALRAYVLDGQTPAAALDRMKEMLRAGSSGGMVGTLLVALFDPATGTLRYSSAGHPPPLVRGADGATRFLSEARGTPLAVGFQNAREAVTKLEPGSLLLLYTDGLVERRAERLGDGLERLERAVAGGTGSAEELLDQVLEALNEAGPSADDTALLALAPVAERAGKIKIELPALRSSVPAARHTLARWLSGAGASEAELYELSVALGDACANAVEHAYGPSDATFHIGAELVDDEVVIDVRDGGRWRQPRGTGRGRGLQLMNAFTDSLEIDTTARGTRVRMRRRLGRRARK